MDNTAVQVNTIYRLGDRHSTLNQDERNIWSCNAVDYISILPRVVNLPESDLIIGYAVWRYKGMVIYIKL